MKNKVGKWEKILVGAVALLLLAPLASLAVLREFYAFKDFGTLTAKVQAHYVAKTPGAPDLTLGEKLAKVFNLNGQVHGGAWIFLALVLFLLVVLVFGQKRQMRRAEGISWLLVFFVFLGPLAFLAVLNGLNIAFAISVLLLVSSTIAIFLYGQRRPEDRELTWGEAFGAAAFVFLVLGLTYAIVPNQFLAWADNELQWRKDKVGFPTPTGIPLFEKGINTLGFLGDGGRGRLIVTKETVRDLIVTNIYAFGLVANFMMWAWWQRRNKVPASQTKAVEKVSAFGRPLVSKG